MFFLPFIAALGIGLGAIGTGVQVMGAMKAAKAAEKAEDLRERQMNLDAMRQKRKIIREAIMQKSIATANATAQGAQDSSGLKGGIAQVTQDAGTQMSYTNKSQEIGSSLFDANREQTQGQSMSSFGSGLSSLGGTLVQNSQTISRLGTYYTQAPY
jgi:hypothetical protein